VSKLTHEDRIKIEALHNAGLSASKIANELGKHRACCTYLIWIDFPIKANSYLVYP
jgi:hypothetical protein